MKRSSLGLLCLLAAALGCGGCSHLPFIGKKKAEKQSRYVATATEKEFEDRWVDKRAAELVSQGQAPDQARDQATQEFFKTFSATTIAPQQQHP